MGIDIEEINKKIKTLDELAQIVQNCKQQGKKVVYYHNLYHLKIVTV